MKAQTKILTSDLAGYIIWHSISLFFSNLHIHDIGLAPKFCVLTCKSANNLQQKTKFIMVAADTIQDVEQVICHNDRDTVFSSSKLGPKTV